jgi:hypothetical protein
VRISLISAFDPFLIAAAKRAQAAKRKSPRIGAGRAL